MVHPTAAIIAAAGDSTRMGTPKALLRHSSGSNFAGFLVNSYKLFGCAPVVLVVNPQLELPEIQSDCFELIVNPQPSRGRSYTIMLGLHKVPEGSPCFIHNVDNPFMEHELHDAMIGKSAPDNYVVPVFNGHGGHPILLGSSIADILRNRNDISDFRQVLHDFHRVEIPYDDKRILLNINSPEDYDQYFFGHLPEVSKTTSSPGPFSSRRRGELC